MTLLIPLVFILVLLAVANVATRCRGTNASWTAVDEHGYRMVRMGC
jgi:hypothetical protein